MHLLYWIQLFSLQYNQILSIISFCLKTSSYNFLIEVLFQSVSVSSFPSAVNKILDGKSQIRNVKLITYEMSIWELARWRPNGTKMLTNFLMREGGVITWGGEIVFITPEAVKNDSEIHFPATVIYFSLHFFYSSVIVSFCNSRNTWK